MPQSNVITVKRPDGYHQIQINGIPRYQDIPYKERWDPHHVAHISNLMSKTMNGWRSQAQARLLEAVFIRRNGNTFSQDRADYAASILKNSWKPENGRTILADEGFAQMMLAAAISVPDKPLRADELISKNGVIYFEQPLFIDSIFQMSHHIPADNRLAKFYKKLPVRAIHWADWGENHIMVTMHSDEKLVDEEQISHLTPEESVHAPLNPHMLYQYMGQIAFGVGSLDTTQEQHDEDHESVKHSIALLRSFKAVLDSQISKGQNAEDMVKAQKKRKTRKASNRKKGDISKVTVVSLVNQQQGRYELEAATGIKIRAHWVRGHWRNQWYPRFNEHRAIWIEGFAKGDPSLGQVHSQTIYTTRSRKQPHTEAPNDD